MTKVGIIVNFKKDSKLSFTSSIVKWLNDNNCEVLLPYSISSKLETKKKSYEQEYIYEQSDFIMVSWWRWDNARNSKKCIKLWNSNLRDKYGTSWIYD